MCPGLLFSLFPAYHHLSSYILEWQQNHYKFHLLPAKWLKHILVFNIVLKYKVVRFKYMDRFVILFTCRSFQLKYPAGSNGKTMPGSLCNYWNNYKFPDTEYPVLPVYHFWLPAAVPERPEHPMGSCHIWYSCVNFLYTLWFKNVHRLPRVFGQWLMPNHSSPKDG